MRPVTYGALVASTVVLAGAAVETRRRERIVARVGAPEREKPSSRSVAAVRGWLERRGRAVGWRGAPLALAAAVVGAAVLGSFIGGRALGAVGFVGGAVAAPAAFLALVRGRATRERARGEAQLREYVQALAASVRAGLSVRRALAEAARDVDVPLRPALDAALRALEVGEPIDAALERLATVAGERDARLLAALLSVHVRSGGDLPALLDDVAAIVGQRIEARRSVRALTAQGRASGAVLAVLPVAFVALLSWTSDGGLGAFYTTPLGMVLLLAGLVCEGLGFFWIRRIVDAPARDQ